MKLLCNWWNRSTEQEISHSIEFHIGNHAADETQEDQHRVVGFHNMACLDHRVRHRLQDSRVAAGMDSWHGHIFKEGEFLHSKGFV